MNCFWRGAVAGAAGTVALDMTTYSDMFLSGRSASSTPSEMTRRLAEMIGCDELATKADEASTETKNRQSAVGAILGMKVGVGVGIVASLGWFAIGKLPRVMQAVIIGGAAMAASDVPMAQLGVSDPKTWSTTDWLRDAIPHFVYGYVTATAIAGMGEGDELKDI